MSMPVYSSEVYQIKTTDVAVLEFKTGVLPETASFKDEIVVLIGHNNTINENGSKDILIQGYQKVRQAIEQNKKFIPVRFAFIPANKRFDLLSPIIRKLRYKIRYYGSNVYHIDPKNIRNMKIERTIKTRQNAYSFTNPRYKMSLQERNTEYDRIFNSIKENGFKDDDPIDIMFCRLLGAKDCVNNGHHRIGMALDLGLDEIPVRFSAAGASPHLLRPLLKFFSTYNLAFKRRFGH